MKYYIGIDLGTTNSAICSFDGTNTRIWKSPEANDVTPSAIYIDKRGNRYYGSKAYQQAPLNPESSAVLFKRFMGTNETIHIKNNNEDLTPEECSSEILKVLYGYLPEEIRNSSETATVITVPAAFNQMKKSATLQAALKAGIQNVSLMQEPVAAVMSIMKSTKQQGIFLVYDLGGGTFDISIAENIGGKVNLLAHGGREMCGGRDIDRRLFNDIVLPWLKKEFNLPEDLLANKKYRKLLKVAEYEAERAKIALSSSENTTIVIEENEIGNLEDESGTEIYAQIPLNRTDLNKIMNELITSTIEETRNSLQKNSLSPNDIETIVFIGGPTNYKPLRDYVCKELSLKPCIDVNPMTAVAEGASIFAESIDWSADNHKKKSNLEVLSTGIDIEFKVQSRVSGTSAKIQCLLKETKEGYSIEVISKDTGWTSGQASLQQNLIISLPITIQGKNTFEVIIRDNIGRVIPLKENVISIIKPVASIGSIPASHSIGVQVLDHVGGKETLDFLVKEGDSLPAVGEKKFKAGQTLKGGSNNSLDFKLWEGEILDPISDNRFIGLFKISGTDLDEDDVVITGAEIICDYEILDSGAVNLKASIPSIGATFGNHNFFSYKEGEIDLGDIDKIAEEGKQLAKRIEAIQCDITSGEDVLDRAYDKVLDAYDIDTRENASPEDVQAAYNSLLEAKKSLYRVRKENYSVLAQKEYDELYNSCFCDGGLLSIANEQQKKEAKNLFARAKHSIDRGDSNFDNIKDEINQLIFRVLIGNERIVMDIYRNSFRNVNDYKDISMANALIAQGDNAINTGNIQELRKIMDQLNTIRKFNTAVGDMFRKTNILKG